MLFKKLAKGFEFMKRDIQRESPSCQSTEEKGSVFEVVNEIENDNEIDLLSLGKHE